MGELLHLTLRRQPMNWRILVLYGEYNTNQSIERLIRFQLDTRLDVKRIWTNVDGSLTVRAFVDNLFDNRNFRSLGSGGPGNNYRLDRCDDQRP